MGRSPVGSAAFCLLAATPSAASSATPSTRETCATTGSSRPCSTSSPPRSTTWRAWSAGATRGCSRPGRGPGRGAERKHTVDHAAAVLLADAAERAGVRPYLLVSSMGVEQAREGTPRGMDPVFAVYLQAKLRAEDQILPRPDLDTTIVRPGRLTDDPGAGRVTLGHGIEFGEIPRDDVAAVLAEILRAGKTGEVVELVGGTTPIAEAVAGLP